MSDAMRSIAARMGLTASDVADAKPWPAESVAAYAARHGGRVNAGAAYPHLPDVQIASAVRMLMRDDLDHEAVVTAARDRICALHQEKAALLVALKGMVRLAEMGFEASLREPEENGNFAAFEIAKAAIAQAEAAPQ